MDKTDKRGHKYDSVGEFLIQHGGRVNGETVRAIPAGILMCPQDVSFVPEPGCREMIPVSGWSGGMEIFPASDGRAMGAV